MIYHISYWFILKVQGRYANNIIVTFEPGLLMSFVQYIFILLWETTTGLQVSNKRSTAVYQQRHQAADGSTAWVSTAVPNVLASDNDAEVTLGAWEGQEMSSIQGFEWPTETPKAKRLGVGCWEMFWDGWGSCTLAFCHMGIYKKTRPFNHIFGGDRILRAWYRGIKNAGPRKRAQGRAQDTPYHIISPYHNGIWRIFIECGKKPHARKSAQGRSARVPILPKSNRNFRQPPYFAYMVIGVGMV